MSAVVEGKKKEAIIDELGLDEKVKITDITRDLIRLSDILTHSLQLASDRLYIAGGVRVELSCFENRQLNYPNKLIVEPINGEFHMYEPGQVPMVNFYRNGNNYSVEVGEASIEIATEKTKVLLGCFHDTKIYLIQT